MMRQLCVVLLVCSPFLVGCAEGTPSAEDVPVTTAPRAAPPERQTEPGPVDEDAPEEFTTAESGLKYRIRRKGEGEKPTAANTVTVHYRGWLDDGTEFDSSYGRGEPTSFPLGNVIAGWTEGLQYVSEGGMIELEIPPELGYGERGQPGIPPNSTLHFIVELIEIK